MFSIHPYIIDTTLRDGEQAPGVVYSRKDKWRIAEMLNELGIDEVEAGTPAIGHEEQVAIKDIASSGFRFKTSCWCRAKTEDILQAATLGTQSINISLPVSDIQIETLGKSRMWIRDHVKNIVSFATQYFPHVTMGAQDATRADAQFLNEFIFYAHESGAERIRISDTVGISDPIEIQQLFTGLKNTFPKVEFEFHGHNDLGMATANTVTALNSGAACVSATVNGIGERAGNASLEEIIAYLFSKKEIKQFNTKIIGKLCRYVTEKSGAIVPDNKGITGRNAFRHESGIHTSAMLVNVKSYQALNPKDFGVNSPVFSFGKHSGKASVIHFFKNKGLPVDEQTAQAILIRVKQMVSTGKIPVTENDLMALYRDIKRRLKSIKNY